MPLATIRIHYRERGSGSANLLSRCSRAERAPKMTWMDGGVLPYIKAIHVTETAKPQWLCEGSYRGWERDRDLFSNQPLCTSTHTGIINAINVLLFFAWALIKGNLDHAELAANDSGRRYTGSEATAHMAGAQKHFLPPHFPLTGLFNVGLSNALGGACGNTIVLIAGEKHSVVKPIFM